MTELQRLEQKLKRIEDKKRRCPACIAKRAHVEEEFKKFHPLTGHGFCVEQGWTHPLLKQIAEAKAKENAEKTNA